MILTPTDFKIKASEKKKIVVKTAFVIIFPKILTPAISPHGHIWRGPEYTYASDCCDSDSTSIYHLRARTYLGKVLESRMLVKLTRSHTHPPS